MRLFLFAGLLGMLMATSAQGATVKRLSLSQLTQMSERVVVGHVLSVASRDAGRTDGLQIVTDIAVRVDETLKGDKANRELRFSQIGGQLTVNGETIEQVVPGYAHFKAGERVVLFMERASGGQLVVAGLAQGKFDVDANGTARRDLEAVHLVGKRPAATFAFAPQNENELPLEALKRWVRRDEPQRPLRIKRRHTAQKTPVDQAGAK